jgi:hypothetical protein
MEQPSTNFCDDLIACFYNKLYHINNSVHFDQNSQNAILQACDHVPTGHGGQSFTSPLLRLPWLNCQGNGACVETTTLDLVALTIQILLFLSFLFQYCKTTLLQHSLLLLLLSSIIMANSFY